ncbi:MAG: hypothetical protein ACQESP_13025 [Candidatus Muiribacteriota bacterium]
MEEKNIKKIQNEFLKQSEKIDFYKKKMDEIDDKILSCMEKKELQKYLKMHRAIHQVWQKLDRENLTFFKKNRDEIVQVDW